MCIHSSKHLFACCRVVTCLCSKVHANNVCFCFLQPEILFGCFNCLWGFCFLVDYGFCGVWVRMWFCEKRGRGVACGLHGNHACQHVYIPGPRRVVRLVCVCRVCILCKRMTHTHTKHTHPHHLTHHKLSTHRTVRMVGKTASRKWKTELQSPTP